MMRILIADDHAVVRQGLKQIIGDEADMQIAGEVQNAAELLQFVRANELDLVILDITMSSGKSGIDVLPEVLSLRSKIKVLILSMHAEEQFAVRALRSGASGYITKQSAPNELVKAIRKVYNGGKYVSESIAEQLVFFIGSDATNLQHERLSDREFQVLRRIAEGRTLKEIAEELFISEKTVGTYRLRILEKMNMKRNAELIRYAVQNKLIE